MRSAELRVDKSWKGDPLPPSEHVLLGLKLWPEQLLVEVDAPFYADPPPPGPAGPLDGLWDFEVVELFLLGEDEAYFELELSPHGHYLALCLRGERRLLRKGMPLSYRAQRAGARWHGTVELPVGLLPSGPWSHNAYAIHGSAGARSYCAAHPCGGAEPDFHRLESFRAIPWQSR